MTARDSRLSRGALYLLVGQAVFLLTGYVLHAVLARWLTPALYGIFGVAMTVLVWAEITVNNGVAPALQKFLPDVTVSESSVRKAAARVQVLITVGIFLLMFLSAPLLARLLRDPSQARPLRSHPFEPTRSKKHRSSGGLMPGPDLPTNPSNTGHQSLAYRTQ